MGMGDRPHDDSQDPPWVYDDFIGPVHRTKPPPPPIDEKHGKGPVSDKLKAGTVAPTPKYQNAPHIPLDQLRKITPPQAGVVGALKKAGAGTGARNPGLAEETRAPSPGSRKLPPARPGNRTADPPSSINPAEPGGGKLPGPQTGKKPAMRPLRSVKITGEPSLPKSPDLERTPLPKLPGTTRGTGIKGTPGLSRTPLPPALAPSGPDKPLGKISAGIKSYGSQMR